MIKAARLSLLKPSPLLGEGWVGVMPDAEGTLIGEGVTGGKITPTQTLPHQGGGLPLTCLAFAALLLFATPVLAQQQPSPAPTVQTQDPPQVSDEVRLIRALAMYRSGRLDLAFAAWDQLAKEGNKEAAYVLRVLAPLRPIRE